MPKFKAMYLFNKIYDIEGEKEIEAKDIKEAIEKFKKALDNKTYESQVKSDLELGGLASVSGTPALFLNGIRVANPADFASIDKLITEKLAN